MDRDPLSEWKKGGPNGWPPPYYMGWNNPPAHPSFSVALVVASSVAFAALIQGLPWMVLLIGVIVLAGLVIRFTD